jgi:hypothetical protein
MHLIITLILAMRSVLRPHTAFALYIPFVLVQAHASECQTNFSSSGSFFSGQAYQTFAALPGTAPDDAFQQAYRFMVKEGWNIQRADEHAGVISALNSNARAGRPMPLNVTVEPAQGGAKITLTYSTPGAALSPEATVKDGFCNIVAAAAVPAQGRAMSGPVHSTAAEAGARARPAGVCLANACIGMTLEEAAKLDLKPAVGRAGIKFSYDKGRAGLYGLDAQGKPVSIDYFSVDGPSIRQFLHTIRTMCVVPDQISARIAASDGRPIDLVFVPAMRNGAATYVLTVVMRLFPENMSASERKRLEQQVREKYGAAFVPTEDISRSIDAFAGKLRNPVAVLGPTSLQLRGPADPQIASKLMDQPGCSNRAVLE